MGAIKQSSANTTSFPGISEAVYSNKFQTFDAARVPLTTGVPSSLIGYGVFVSDSKFRAGSYSVTSTQDTYRMINQSLLSKTGK